jgi:hypothetical protein
VPATQNVVQAWFGRRRGGRYHAGAPKKKESASFLKKRSKKLLLPGRAACLGADVAYDVHAAF